jgi:hypothetical protein
MKYRSNPKRSRELTSVLVNAHEAEKSPQEAGLSSAGEVSCSVASGAGAQQTFNPILAACIAEKLDAAAKCARIFIPVHEGFILGPPDFGGWLSTTKQATALRLFKTRNGAINIVLGKNCTSVSDDYS